MDRRLNCAPSGRMTATRRTSTRRRRRCVSRSSGRTVARILCHETGRGGAWRRPASRSTMAPSRRSARERAMRRAARSEALDRRTHPCYRATYSAGSPSQDNAHLRASDPAAPARPALDRCELDSRRISYGSGRARNVSRCKRRRAEQTDNEREGEKALAREIHDWIGGSRQPVRQTS
jgi:hypothetical protein